uniref:Phosphatidylethanolamine N-methyltransferase n=1 Tax=Rhodosorus marinus TaxID=101924 RepID=A0A7S3EI63_9RHOD|mmetsp:Transcript_35866/g.143339  ORF Transcript_35866/g.143339 Transcript_35866/m.143339 type:complete len:297 (+) Transcript_35866:74-964(+)
MSYWKFLPSDLSLVREGIQSVGDKLESVLEVAEPYLEPVFEVEKKLPHVFEAPSKLLSSAFVKMPQQSEYVNLSDPLFSRAFIVIALCPLIWNLLGRLEYKTKIISKIFFGRYPGCYALATWIFCFSLFRDKTFLEVLRSPNQPECELLAKDEYLALAGVLFVLGLVLIVSAYIRLGVVGTYLGDYFGILFEEKLEGFPFSASPHPMYDGASMLFAARALVAQSMAGVLLACWVYIVYRIASVFEESFTDFIYSEKQTHDRKATKSSQSVTSSRVKTVQKTKSKGTTSSSSNNKRS